ncbi:MAG: hypothetical protein RIE73_27990 [Coleofasciculus sp. C1-SOL-03]|uniref:hypothetical protein n=1 Tax=Coleofasciculus sp. C1-SOL-03 TaxID=3069522 RepID=UPI003304089D
MKSATLERSKGRLSSASNPIKRLIQGDFTQRFGRFLICRRIYSLLQARRQRLNPDFYKKRLKIASDSMFDGVSLDKCVQQLRHEGVGFGLHLSPSMVKEIYQYAIQTPCIEPESDDEFFIEEVIRKGRRRGEHPVLRALVRDAMDCEAIQKITQDPLLLQIVKNYLGYWPNQITQHLTWSLVSDLSEPEIRQSYPPTNFHYDIAGYNFMTAYFYITDVKADSGAHVMIKGSHQKKPLYMTFSAGRQSDKTVLNYYGQDNQLIIEGESGFGFVQDPSCIHRVISPVKADRLLLQIRYS